MIFLAKVRRVIYMTAKTFDNFVEYQIYIQKFDRTAQVLSFARNDDAETRGGHVVDIKNDEAPNFDAFTIAIYCRKRLEDSPEESFPARLLSVA